MNPFLFNKFKFLIMSIFLLVMPALVHAQQPEQAKADPPPIEQKMVREGTFAVKLEMVLNVGASEDEAEAESRLSEVGITPRNGWIADYPVTPDIIGEVLKSVRDAADAGKISFSVNDALKKTNEV